MNKEKMTEHWHTRLTNILIPEEKNTMGQEDETEGVGKGGVRKSSEKIELMGKHQAPII